MCLCNTGFYCSEWSLFKYCVQFELNHLVQAASTTMSCKLEQEAFTTMLYNITSQYDKSDTVCFWRIFQAWSILARFFPTVKLYPCRTWYDTGTLWLGKLLTIKVPYTLLWFFLAVNLFRTTSSSFSLSGWDMPHAMKRSKSLTLRNDCVSVTPRSFWVEIKISPKGLSFDLSQNTLNPAALSLAWVSFSEPLPVPFVESRHWAPVSTTSMRWESGQKIKCLFKTSMAHL